MSIFFYKTLHYLNIKYASILITHSFSKFLYDIVYNDSFNRLIAMPFKKNKNRQITIKSKSLNSEENDEKFVINYNNIIIMTELISDFS